MFTCGPTGPARIAGIYMYLYRHSDITGQLLDMWMLPDGLSPEMLNMKLSCPASLTVLLSVRWGALEQSCFSKSVGNTAPLIENCCLAVQRCLLPLRSGNVVQGKSQASWNQKLLCQWDGSCPKGDISLLLETHKRRGACCLPVCLWRKCIDGAFSSSWSAGSTSTFWI